MALVLQLVRPGDLVLAAHDCYGGTHRILRSLAARGQFDVEFVNLSAEDAAKTPQPATGLPSESSSLPVSIRLRINLS